MWDHLRILIWSPTRTNNDSTSTILATASSCPLNYSTDNVFREKLQDQACDDCVNMNSV